MSLGQVERTQPAGVHAVGRHEVLDAGSEVGRRVAELAAALVALDDRAADAVRPSEDDRGALDVALGEAGSRTSSRTSAAGRRGRRGRMTSKSCARAELAQRVDVAGVLPAEPDVLADDDRAGVERRRRRPARRTPRRQPGDLRGERHHQHASSPDPASSFTRLRQRGERGGARSGRSTASGCGSKVTATEVASRARSPARPAGRARDGARGAHRRSCRGPRRNGRGRRGPPRGRSRRARGTL